MELRKANSSDVDKITDLFRSTVQNVNSKDYNQKQIEVWSSVADRKKGWIKVLQEQKVIVTTHKNKITGFGTITKEGFINFLYVHHLFQRQGVAKLILEKLEEIAVKNNNSFIYCNASNTAKNFFLKKGFKVIRQSNQEAEGLIFEMTRLEKNI